MARAGAARTRSTIAFDAVLHRPARPANAAWLFLVLPADANTKLPSRGLVTADGHVGGCPVRTTLQPDGRGGHWMKVERTVRDAIGVHAGDVVPVQLSPVEQEPEPRVPADLRAALAATPAAKAQWSSLTPVARRDWIQWLDSAKQAATRERRIASTCDMLVAGKRRVCCFDRSGVYGKGMAAPEALD